MLQQICVSYAMGTLLCQPWIALAACLLLADWLVDVLAAADVVAPAVASVVALDNVEQPDVPKMLRQRLSAAACLQRFDEISAVARRSHSSMSGCA